MFRKTGIISGVALLLAPAAHAQTGGTSASQSAGANYATAGTSGDLNMDALRAMPRAVAPLAVPLKPAQAKFLAGKRRVFVPSYAIRLNRSGKISAYAGGFGSSNAGRRSTLTTILIGVPDELMVQLAGEAHRDLVDRLKAVGYEVITTPPPGGPAPFTETRRVAGQPVYGPADAPLVSGLPGVDYSSTAFNHTVGRGGPEHEAVVLLAGMSIDYEQFQGGGMHMYSGRASVGATVGFHIQPASGAIYSTFAGSPYNNAWGGSFLSEHGVTSDEPFGLISPLRDHGSYAGLDAALVQAGVGGSFKQKGAYAVEVEPGRFTALVRAAFQGMNSSIVQQLQTAAAGH